MYSQNNEDNIILSNLPDNFQGTILDVGANDGKTYSNSRMFIEKYNWDGVLVEPSHHCIQLLNTLYENNEKVQIIPYAIDLDNKDKTLYVGNIQDTPTSINLVSTLKSFEKEYWENNRGVKYKEETVKCITIKKLLELSKFKYFDIVSIDVEGLDFEILSGLIDYNIKPQFIIIEHNSVQSTLEKIGNLINDSYIIIHNNSINNIYKLK
jgi:FkbM family methyltransferase